MPADAPSTTTEPHVYEPEALLREGDGSLFEPETYILALVTLGVIALATVLLPRLLARRPLTMPMIFLALGYTAFGLPLGLNPPDLTEQAELVKRLTELGVIISLFSAGLKIENPLSWKTWRISWRLLAITMPLTIAGVALLGWIGLALAPASAILLGAVVAPTDPVLASDVHTTPPGEEDEDEGRVALTTEAGLNDGLAFPFTNLAIALAIVGLAPRDWLVPWLAVDVAYKIVVGVVVGVGSGWLLGVLFFRLPRRGPLARMITGSAALPMTLLSYGITELIAGYGFIAVFVAACVVRQMERHDERQKQLHDFAEEVERLVAAVLLVLLDGAIAGGLFGTLTWPGVLVALATLLVVRPASGMVGLLGAPMARRERFAISFLGIRGIGSLYYLAYAITQAPFDETETLWAVLALMVVVSIFLHGSTAPMLMRWAEASTRTRSSEGKVSARED